MEEIAFKVQLSVQKPVEEVFNAVVDPAKLSSYFTEACSAPLQKGTQVAWKFAEADESFPVHVTDLVPNEKIQIMWEAQSGEYQTTVDFSFQDVGGQSTLVVVKEKGWKPSDRKYSYQNCMGWTHMLCCLKGFLEYGINLRKGSFIMGEAQGGIRTPT